MIKRTEIIFDDFLNAVILISGVDKYVVSGDKEQMI